MRKQELIQLLLKGKDVEFEYDNHTNNGVSRDTLTITATVSVPCTYGSLKKAIEGMPDSKRRSQLIRDRIR